MGAESRHFSIRQKVVGFFSCHHEAYRMRACIILCKLLLTLMEKEIFVDVIFLFCFVSFCFGKPFDYAAVFPVGTKVAGGIRCSVIVYTSLSVIMITSFYSFIPFILFIFIHFIYIL